MENNVCDFILSLHQKKRKQQTTALMRIIDERTFMRHIKQH